MREKFTQQTGHLLTRLAQILPPEVPVRNGCFIQIVTDAKKFPENAVVRHRFAAPDASLIAATFTRPVPNSAEASTQQYAAAFASCLLSQYREYLTDLTTFSKKRDIGERKLYQDMHFRQVVGEILKWIELAELSLAEPEIDLKNAFSYLLQVSDKCTKVLGGQALRSGSTFDLQILCHLVENTYVK